MNVKQFRQLPIMGILRGIKSEQLGPLVDAIIASGLKTVEVTMNTPDASHLIREMVVLSRGQLTVGAGTVLCLDDLNSAIASGATFIVSPVCIPEVIQQCTREGIAVFPGALTPQEIYLAWQSGATMVKVFPSKFFGPDYFTEIKAPLAEIQLMACGGVTADNMTEFFKKGASAVSFGASIFKREWLQRKEFGNIQSSIEALIRTYKGFCGGLE
ncbi:MAG: bifunctional 4-hydroxy-2-oxoglutarate aldolase/2-dehydro-3-deoxy-phosphogluconate aldolase [Chlamydiota bacterium]|nr:bifunctional 4-hydroxy-2-oxoglutarate aldolase/2-dehydro-3-deoxy-phosphogluconate aldolase [Chlamydiota bacterium]